MCTQTEGHPYYTQHLCYVLWEQAEDQVPVTEELLANSISILLERENVAYTTLLETLTKNQKRFLIGIASESGKFKPFGREFIQRYNLGSSSNAQRTATSLMGRDIIDKDNGSFIIVDRFLKIWIQNNFVKP